MSPTQKVAVLLVTLGVGLGLGYYFAPAKIVEVVKIVEKTHVQTHVDTDTRIIKRPDGTTETVIKERDRSTTDNDKTTDRTKTTLARGNDDWIASLLIEPQGLTPATSKNDFTLLLQRHIILGIYAGPYLSGDGEFGIGLSLKF